MAGAKTAGSHKLRRAAVILAARGGTLDGITIGDVLELLDTESQVHGAARSEAAACYRLLRETGIFGPAAPARLRQLRTAGKAADCFGDRVLSLRSRHCLQLPRPLLPPVPDAAMCTCGRSSRPRSHPR